jgi:hypothetical protein
MLSAHDIRDSWSDAAPTPFWLDSADRPAARPALDGSVTADLVVRVVRRRSNLGRPLITRWNGTIWK